ncbi:MAG: type II secretion system protein [Nitrosomonadales bacterium]|nr:type II secretion system protein [Nitrosomonadales bacterium]
MTSYSYEFRVAGFGLKAKGRTQAATQKLKPVTRNSKLVTRNPKLETRNPQNGFTLVEMIVVIVITGILGGMVAMFIRAPVQGYMDSARRAEMTDIADTALRRIERDLRTALPNSVRVTTSGGTTYLEYLETIGGGRYNSVTVPVDCLNLGNCTALTTTGNLVTGAAGAASNALATGGNIVPGTSRLVIYNQYNNSGANCSAANPSAYCAVGSGGGPVITGVTNGATDANADVINFAATTFVPSGGAPSSRFQLVSQPVTYACTPNGTLTRYSGYAMQAAQSTSLATLTSAQAGAVLATNVGATCNFRYDAFAVAQSYGLVTLNLSISEQDASSGQIETVNLYSATHVSNIP